MPEVRRQMDEWNYLADSCENAGVGSSEEREQRASLDFWMKQAEWMWRLNGVVKHIGKMLHNDNANNT